MEGPKVLLEKKVAAGSIAAALTAGLVALAVFIGAKFGVVIDPMVATPVATTAVVFVVTWVAGYLAKHTERPDLAEKIEVAVGVTDATDAEIAAESASDDIEGAELARPV